MSRMLDLAQDVPYNVQALASHCWYRLIDEAAGGEDGFTPEFVDETLALVVRQQEHTGYVGTTDHDPTAHSHVCGCKRRQGSHFRESIGGGGSWCKHDTRCSAIHG